MFGPDRFTMEEMNDLSYKKEEKYQQEFLPHLALLPGLHEFLEAAYQRGIPMAIGSAAIPFNIDYVLDNLNIRHYFKAIVSADDVILSKPHPETFLKAAQLLDTVPGDCVVFEDVPKGVEAAANAGMKAIVITTTHEQHEFEKLTNVLHYSTDFKDDYFMGMID
jgi:HAD superfamily hydrolase (TIGR01509 family)